MTSHSTLALFLHLSRSLRFARTAEECRVSPAALSRSIQRLEREVGATLFLRDKRNVALTDAGRRLQRYAGDMLDGWASLQRQLHGEELEGELSIFCTATAAQSFLPEILGRFRASNPGVQLRLETGYMADALGALEAGTDMTVTGLPERLPRSIVAHALFVTPLVFVAPTAPGEVSRSVERRAISWGHVPLVLPPFGAIRTAVDRWFRQRGEHPRVYSEVASHEAILSLVAMGCGVGVVPRIVLERSPQRDRLREVDVRRPVGDLQVAACVLRRRLREPLVAALWDAFRGHD